MSAAKLAYVLGEGKSSVITLEKITLIKNHRHPLLEAGLGFSLECIGPQFSAE